MSRGRLAAWRLFFWFPLLVGCQSTDTFFGTSPSPLNKSEVVAVSARKAVAAALPPSGPPSPKPPLLPFSHVLSPELPRRPISLPECIALALENGRTGDFYDGPEGRQKSSVTGVRPQTPLSSATDSIRVFAHDPAIVGTEIEESLARFDVWSETGLFWNRIDQKNRYLTTLDAFQQTIAQNKLDRVNFQNSLFKRLPTGGLAGVQFLTDVDKNFLTNNTTLINPAYRPRFDLFLEQPLLQGSGNFINQLRDFAPTGFRRNYPDHGKAPGILLVRITHKQTQLEFERQVHELVYRVEEAYWKLHSAYWNFYSSDNGMKQALAAWQIAQARFDAGGIGIEDLAMIEEQLHFFRNERLQALGSGQPGRPGVLEAERNLRYVTGLPPEDGWRLVPSNPVAFEGYEPDLEQSLADARNQRPEMRQIDQEIEAAHLGLLKAEDRLQPDLLFVGKYGVNGLGNSLGAGLDNLVSSPRGEWETGLRMQFPLGFRAGHAEVARARTNLAQRQFYLKDQKEKLVFSLQRSHRDLVQHREQYKIRQSQRVAAAKQLKARFEKFRAGGDPKTPGSSIDLLLRAQRNWVDALREEYVALCQYRTSIADFERQKGTILQFAQVSITEGPMASAAVPCASKFFKEQPLGEAPGSPWAIGDDTSFIGALGQATDTSLREIAKEIAGKARETVFSPLPSSAPEKMEGPPTPDRPSSGARLGLPVLEEATGPER